MGGLRHLLRHDTADLHHAVEEAVDLPRSIASRSDYGRLLGRLHGFHAAVEEHLARPPWRGRWAEVGIDLRRHERSSLLARDLARLGPVAPGAPTDLPEPGLPEHFGGALGTLYVLEGSSLGGRVLGPAVRQVLGDVPTGFFDGDGRRHPSPWRGLQEALRRYESTGGDPEPVLAGARATFVAFGRHVGGDRFTAGPVR